MGDQNNWLPDYLLEAGPRQASDVALWANMPTRPLEPHLRDARTAALLSDPDRAVNQTGFSTHSHRQDLEELAKVEPASNWGVDTTFSNADAALRDMDWADYLAEEERKRRERNEKFDRDMAALGSFDGSRFMDNIAGYNAAAAAFDNLLGTTVAHRTSEINNLVDPLEQAELVAWLNDAQAHDLGTPEDLRDAFDLGTNMIGVRKQSGDAADIEAMAAAVNAQALADIIASQDSESFLEEEHERIAGLIGEYQSEENEAARARFERDQLAAMAAAQAAFAKRRAALEQGLLQDLAGMTDDFKSRDEWEADRMRDAERAALEAEANADATRRQNAYSTALDVVNGTRAGIELGLNEGRIPQQVLFDLTGETLLPGASPDEVAAFYDKLYTAALATRMN